MTLMSDILQNCAHLVQLMIHSEYVFYEVFLHHLLHLSNGKLDFIFLLLLSKWCGKWMESNSKLSRSFVFCYKWYAQKVFWRYFPKNKKRFQAQNVTETTLTKNPIVYKCKYVLYLITWNIFMYHKHLEMQIRT